MHTILVADDSVTIQRAVEIVFDKEPFTVVKAGSGAEAMIRVREQRPDLILADHTMGDLSGYDLAAGLKADPATAGIPIVLLSAAASPYDEGRGRAVGVIGHVQKPFDCATLLDRVRGILGIDATAPGSFVSSVPTATAASANMPRPPSLGGFAGLPRPAVPTFPPRPASLPPTPVQPAPPAARSLDPFGLGATLSQPPVAAAAPAATLPSAQTPPSRPSAGMPPAAPPAPQAAVPPLTSPTSVAAVNQSGWQAMAPGQGIALPPAATQPPWPAVAAPAVAAPAVAAPAVAAPAVAAPNMIVDTVGGLAELSDSDLEVLAASPAPPSPVAQAMEAATSAVVATAATAIAATTGEAPSREVLSMEARAIIERIVWEVVPELAELIIKEELARLLKAR
jgi:CheY-like chemotaxis protein